MDRKSNRNMLLSLENRKGSRFQKKVRLLPFIRVQNIVRILSEYSPCFRKSKGFRFQNFHTDICFQTPEYFPFFKKTARDAEYRKVRQLTIIRFKNILLCL